MSACRSSIYSLVDKVILMAGGHTAYYGPGGAVCAGHFCRIGLKKINNQNDT